MNQALILRDALKQYVRNHNDIFVATGIPLVLDEATTVSPELLVAIGTTEDPREAWSVDLEGAPDVLIVAADSTANAPERYQTIGVRELFVFDAAAHTVKGYWLAPHGFAPITPNDNGRVPCEELRLDLGFHAGPAGLKLRFYRRDGALLETPSETEAVRRAHIARLIETHEIEIDEHDERLKR